MVAELYYLACTLTVRCAYKMNTWNFSLPEVKLISMDWFTQCLERHSSQALLKTSISRSQSVFENVSPKNVLASVQYWEAPVISFSLLLNSADSALNRKILKFPVTYDFLCTMCFTCMFYMTCKLKLILAKRCDYGIEYGLQ